MIAVKRRLLRTYRRFFVERMSIYKTGDKSLYNITVCQEDRNDVMVLGFNLGHTRESVQSPLVVLM